MTPFQRLNNFMPFVIMFYLMMSLAQLHAMPWMRWGEDGLESVNFLKGLETDYATAWKNDRIAFPPGDPTHYSLGDFVPP
ncbi:MAG: hypothetical protein ACLP8A_01345 [Methylovirgula sp.]